MSLSVEFYFDVGSPTAYLAYTQLPGICGDVGAELIWRPMLLGAVHKATNNASPAFVIPKGRWMQTDLQRFAKRYGVTYTHNPYFPINTLRLMRGATGTLMKSQEMFNRYLKAVFEAMWVDQRDMNQPEVIGAVLSAAKLDVGEILAMTEDPAVKEQLKADTEEAVGRGVFGAPTMFFGKYMYFGQDRLEFLKEDLAEERAKA